jgi:hypothetical protein
VGVDHAVAVIGKAHAGGAHEVQGAAGAQAAGRADREDGSEELGGDVEVVEGGLVAGSLVGGEGVLEGGLGQAECVGGRGGEQDSVVGAGIGQGVPVEGQDQAFVG